MRLRCLIAGVAIWGLSVAVLRAAPAGQPVDDVIARLGDPDPTVRNDALRTLRDAGADAKAALQSAAQSDNPEIAVRARDLLKAKPKVVMPASMDDEGQEPSVIRYRASAPAAKRQTISFIAFSPGGVRALVKLWTLETDPELRAAIFQEMIGRPSTSASAMLASGNYATAQTLLETAVDRKADGSLESYAAYAMCRGTVDDAIRRWSSRGAEKPDGWATQVLSSLYRAKGDARQALDFAQASGNPQLIRQTKMWAGDWAGIADDIRQANAGGLSVNELSTIAGLHALTGDSKSLDADVTLLKNMAQPPAAFRVVSNTLLLIGRPDDATELCLSAKEYATAYEQMMVRGRFDQAAALLSEHDSDASPAAVMLRCTAAKILARFGDLKQAAPLIQRIVKDRGVSPSQQLNVALAEAEREAGMDEAAWAHFADAYDAPQPRSAPVYSQAPFPSRNDNVDWGGIWFAVQSQNLSANPPRTGRQIFERVHTAYNRSMPVDDLKTAINGVDLSTNSRSPYIGLAWEVTQRMIEAGDEAGGIRYAEQIASQAEGGELYLDLGDRAALNGDWPTAAVRYAAAWRKGPLQALPLYLEGLALVHCGQTALGHDRMARASLIPLGEDFPREELVRGLAVRGFADNAAAEANVLIRTGAPLGGAMDMALRIAGDRDAEQGQSAVAAELFKRSTLDFVGGGMSFPEQLTNLYLATRPLRARARQLALHGDWPAAQEQIKACYNILPDDIEIAIDLVPDLEKLGKKAEADALFNDCFAGQQALCARFPNSPNQHNQAAWLAAKCNRELDHALEHARRAVELMPKRTSYIDTLAEVYFVRGQYDEAIAEMKKCVALEPMVWRHRRQIERFEAKKAAPNKPAMPTPSSGD